MIDFPNGAVASHIDYTLNNYGENASDGDQALDYISDDGSFKASLIQKIKIRLLALWIVGEIVLKIRKIIIF